MKNLIRATGVVTKGGTLSLGECAIVHANPNRNYLHLSNDNVGDLIVVIGGTLDKVAQSIADGNYFVLHGKAGGNQTGDSMWTPSIIPTDNIFLVCAEDPVPVDFKVSVATDSKITLDLYTAIP